MIDFEATYYDGKSSKAHAVRVIVHDTGHLEIVGLDEPLGIPLVDVKISARLGNTARFLRFKDGAKVETLDNNAVDRILRARGVSYGNRFVHWLESNWGIALAALAITALVCLAGVKWGVPWGARKMAYAIPIEAVQSMSTETLKYMDGLMFKPTDLDDKTTGRLRTKFKSMARLEPRLRVSLNFRSGKSTGPNAFALPDGSIVVTDELVKLADNDEQILCILAHEIGHVSARHALRNLLETSAFGLLLTAVTGEISSSISAVGAIPAVLVQAKYSRELEAEADEFALQLMAKAKIEKHHFADIMEALVKVLPDYSNSIISTHPPTAERIRRFR